MKKIFLNFVLVVFGCLNAISQGCLPQGITFTTQAQIDSFPINYPGCTLIEGDVTIWGSWDITNLTALSSVSAVGGNFTINDSHALDDFTGLDNLQSIGGNVLIKNNINQISFAGLQNLTTIGGNFDTYQYYNTSLTSFQGLNSLITIGGSFSVTIYSVLNNFLGLDNLTSIGGAFQVSYTSILNFSGLDSLISIGGNLSISGNLYLENFSGLQRLSALGSHLYIHGNPRLTNIEGLINLLSIGGNINIYTNDSLVSLYGIDNISAGTINQLSIYSNHSLSTCEVKSVCDYLAVPQASVYINDNSPDCSSIEEVKAACDWLSKNDFISNHELSIYPNPSDGQFTFEFALQQQSMVKIVVVNSLGQLVAVLANGLYPSGLHHLNWNPVNQPPGIYYLRLHAGAISDVQKLLLIR
jgi:hypothetical protein